MTIPLRTDDEDLHYEADSWQTEAPVQEEHRQVEMDHSERLEWLFWGDIPGFIVIASDQ